MQACNDMDARVDAFEQSGGLLHPAEFIAEKIFGRKDAHRLHHAGGFGEAVQHITARTEVAAQNAVKRTGYLPAFIDDRHFSHGAAQACGKLPGNVPQKCRLAASRRPRQKQSSFQRAERLKQRVRTAGQLARNPYVDSTDVPHTHNGPAAAYGASGKARTVPARQGQKALPDLLLVAVDGVATQPPETFL